MLLETAARTGMIELDDLVRVFGRGEGAVRALDGVTLSLDRGSFTAIMGPSGSGKSTLLQLAAGLDRPTSGGVRIGDQHLDGLSENALARLRRERIGFVFQSFNLLGALTAEQNVSLPSRLAGRRVPRATIRAALEGVGLGDRVKHRPAQLSGGQQQRVAIARALVGRPAIVLADEPTGNLDSSTGASIMGLIRELNAAGATILIITHDAGLADGLPRRIRVLDGRVVSDTGAAA
jgi:putative ABC transport system ATP-binding protein